jgi:putative membrane protein
MNKKTNSWFKYVVIIAVLLVPFMYSFFYLKAYWNPYGKGNIDNLPVAVVNKDSGDKGKELIDNIKESKKLKLSIVSNDEATDGLNDGKYYAIISIPKDFTSSMNSASSTNKRHATITYSPNQKSNYLSSQIINTVVLTVEKNLDNTVNSKIVENLSDNLKAVPTQLNTISTGFGKLSEGTSQIENGASELKSGSEQLKNGINEAYNGSKTITDGVNASIENLKNDKSEAIDTQTLNNIKNQVTSSVNATFTDTYKNAIGVQAVETVKAQYENNINLLKQGILANISAFGITDVDAYCNSSSVNPGLANYCSSYLGLVSLNNQLNDSSSVIYQSIYNTAITSAQKSAVQTASNVSETVAKQVATSAKETATNKSIASLTPLQEGLNSLTSGLAKLNTGSNDLYNGTVKLNEGTTTLNNSVKASKVELDNKISSTKSEMKKVDGLSKYSKMPIKAETKEVNKVSSYGTAFSPLFISIALWVGSLMLFMVLYFDKEKRFGLLGIDSKKRVKRTLAYHGLASASGLILGILLQLLLDFSITNVLLYYVSIILIANCFLAIVEFLIETFGDIGKFIALIILVLQLAAAGGTFPIETVTKGFRWLHPLLPMTYTINLLKESLVSVENNLLTQNMLYVFIIFIVFFGLNIILNFMKQKKDKTK